MEITLEQIKTLIVESEERTKKEMQQMEQRTKQELGQEMQRMEERTKQELGQRLDRVEQETKEIKQELFTVKQEFSTAKQDIVKWVAGFVFGGAVLVISVITLYTGMVSIVAQSLQQAAVPTASVSQTPAKTN